MKPQPDDGGADLRQLFSQLAQEDRSRAQPFAAHEQALHQAAAAGATGGAAAGPWPLRLGAAAAAALLLALALVLWLPAAGPRPRRQASLADLSRWQAPTDFLLHTPGEALLRSVPRLGTTRNDGPFGGESR